MKKIVIKKVITVLNTALTSSILGILLFAMSCSKHHVTPASEKVTQQLEAASPWRIQSVNRDGVDQTAQFTGMTLTFTNTSFTTTNGEPLWAASGTWSFDDATAKTFKRNDNIDVSITAISVTNLTLTLMWNETTYASGRINSTNGNYQFVFMK